jgi:hypothetical protein
VYVDECLIECKKGDGAREDQYGGGRVGGGSSFSESTATRESFQVQVATVSLPMVSAEIAPGATDGKSLANREPSSDRSCGRGSVVANSVREIPTRLGFCTPKTAAKRSPISYRLRRSGPAT